MKKKRIGVPLPGYLACSLLQLFGEYKKRLSGRYFTDPLGNNIRFFDHNFPKLIQMQRRSTGGNTKAKASKVLQEIQSGAFAEENYCWDKSRSSILLVMPDIIVDPDSIHGNGHATIPGDIVYVRRYAKAGSPFKLIFTHLDKVSARRIVTTSFWVREDRLTTFVRSPAMWEKEKAAVSSGLL